MTTNLFRTAAARLFTRQARSDRRRAARHTAPKLGLEALEGRDVPSGAEWYASPPTTALTPDQIRTAYAVSGISFGGSTGIITGDGAGQTIAIIDALDDPRIVSDLTNFDTSSLATTANELNARPVSSFFSVVTQTGAPMPPPGSPGNPGADTTGLSEEEESLDVEWAHVIAPMANIILVECNSFDPSDIIAGGVNWARNASGVSVVSLSIGYPESYIAQVGGEAYYDQFFTTPSNHNNVTFIAGSGDHTAPDYPGLSPDVLAVGGTSLTVNPNNTYGNETVWNDLSQQDGGASGGGLSEYESRPAYQASVSGIVGAARGIPDVAFDADPNTGVPIYDSYLPPSDSTSSPTNGGTSYPWGQFGGTSLGAPVWAGLIAITDQGRAAAGLVSPLNGSSALDGSSQTLPGIYSLPATDFHDITTGSNGVTGQNGNELATTGYDLATGRGTPIASSLINDLATSTPLSPSTVGTAVAGHGESFYISDGGLLYVYRDGQGSTWTGLGAISGSSEVTSISVGKDISGKDEVAVLNAAGQMYVYDTGASGDKITYVVGGVTAMTEGHAETFFIVGGNTLYVYRDSSGSYTDTNYPATSLSPHVGVNSAGNGDEIAFLNGSASELYTYDPGPSGVGTRTDTLGGNVTAFSSGQGKTFFIAGGDLYIYYDGSTTGNTPTGVQATALSVGTDTSGDDEVAVLHTVMGSSSLYLYDTHLASPFVGLIDVNVTSFVEGHGETFFVTSSGTSSSLNVYQDGSSGYVFTGVVSTTAMSVGSAGTDLSGSDEPAYLNGGYLYLYNYTQGVPTDIRNPVQTAVEGTKETFYISGGLLYVYNDGQGFTYTGLRATSIKIGKDLSGKDEVDVLYGTELYVYDTGASVNKVTDVGGNLTTGVFAPGKGETFFIVGGGSGPGILYYRQDGTSGSVDTGLDAATISVGTDATGSDEVADLYASGLYLYDMGVTPHFNNTSAATGVTAISQGHGETFYIGSNSHLFVDTNSSELNLDTGYTATALSNVNLDLNNHDEIAFLNGSTLYVYDPSSSAPFTMITSSATAAFAQGFVVTVYIGSNHELYVYNASVVDTGVQATAISVGVTLDSSGSPNGNEVAYLDSSNPVGSDLYVYGQGIIVG